MLNVELEMLFEGAFGFIISTQSRNRSAELLRSRPEAPCRFNTSTLDLPNTRFLFVSAFSGVSSNCRPFHADWWFCNVGPWCGKFSSNFTEVEMFVVKGGKNDVDPRSSTGNKAFGDGNVIGIGNGVAIDMATDVDTDAPRCDSLNGDNSVGIPVPNPLVPTGMGELIAKGDGKLNTVDAAEAPLQIEVAVVGTCTCSCLRNVCAMDMFICSEVAVSWTWHCLVFSLSFAAWRQRRRYVEYQWFLIALSVLPGSNFAISAQRDQTHFEPMAAPDAASVEMGPLLDGPDPRSLKAAIPHSGGASATGRTSLLRMVDARKWHYAMTFILFLDFAAQLMALAFTPKQYLVANRGVYKPVYPQDFTIKYYSGEQYGRIARLASSGVMAVSVVDILLRVCGLSAALFRSRSNMADVFCVIAAGGLLGCRYVFLEKEYDYTLGYFGVVALRLILKPRARTFSKKLHKFRANGDQIRISIESLRASLARIPGISALAIEAMETDLLIICGRDSGDMTRNELMSFLERALRHRPPTLSATEFLSNLRDIDASSTQIAYGVGDVIRSTLVHWSNQVIDLILCLLAVCVNAAISPLMAYFLSRLTDAFNSRWDTLGRDKDLYYFAVLGLFALSVPFVIGDYSVGYFQSKMIAKATERMQNNLLATILRQNTAFFADRSEGDLNNLFASDVARVNSLWQAVFWNFFNPLVSVCFGFGYALYMRYSIGVLAFGFTAVLLSSGPQGYAAHRSKQFASKNAYVAADFQNAVACEKVVRAYGIQKPLVERFKKTNVTLRKAQFSKDFWAGLVQIYIETAMYIFTAVLTTALALKVWNRDKYPEDKIKAGDFFAFITLLQRVSNPVTVLGGFMRVAIGNAGSLQRVDDVIVGLNASKHNSHNNDKNLPGLPKMEKDLRIEKLNFRYDKTSEQYVLLDFNAIIPRGSYTCIVGPSGCGKSTLLACLMQFQEADGGCIRLDGHDIFNYSKASFMNQTAVVFQDGGILNGTIYDNIRYGNISATNAECEEAARLAECHFIKDLKDGFETIVGQHATANLSGGQAQRLCLARALCRKPSLLLLDEATSALDPETEASIVVTLERLSSKMNMTILSVTHRLSTAVNANQILVLNKGRVAEEGRYDELVRKGGLFSEMVHKTDDSDEDDQKKPPAGRHMSIGRHQSVDTIGLAREDSADASAALQQFTKTLSTRVGNETELARAGGGTSWYRYGNRNSNRSRQQSDDTFVNRRSGNTSLMEGGQWFGDGRRQATSSAASEDERNKYFVL